MEKHLKANKKVWDQRVAVHLKSDFYDLPGWRAGATSLKPIELALLGDIQGKELCHLQCHFGQDTLSLARMGAKVTGLDLSSEAISTARGLAEELKLDANFVEADVLKMTNHLDGPFDIIFTSYGVTGWLPELSSWGQQIAKLLKPGGYFLIVEFHPFIWMYDDDVQKIDYAYFNLKPYIEISEGTYTEGGEHLSDEAYYWNHSLSDVFQSLKNAGLEISHFSEYDYSPYKVFPRPVEVENGYQIEELAGKIPLVYAMKAHKPL